MKNKIKKWHIALMSFMALFIAVFASLFSLKAEPTNSETNEIITGTKKSNWELEVVFFDSSVDDGMKREDGTYDETKCKTPLKEIKWDASDGTRLSGDSRIITMQINYRNENITKDYAPGEVKIKVPNLGYCYTYYGYGEKYRGSMQGYLSASMTIGANDSTHSGYDWDIVDPSPNFMNQREFLEFTNANTIPADHNFEGSIQIVVVFRPCEEDGYLLQQEQKFLDECTRSYFKDFTACLFEGSDFKEELQTITTSNWPSRSYGQNITKTWEYTREGASEITLYFDEESSLATGDYIKIYNKEGKLVKEFTTYKIAKEALVVQGDYVKIEFYSGDSYSRDGFCIYFDMPASSVIFDYTRTYIHPWEHATYKIVKTASKIASYDGLGNNASDYYWVNYKFIANINEKTYPSYNYPYIIAKDTYIEDIFDEDCVVYMGGELVSPAETKNNEDIYQINIEINDQNSTYRYNLLTVGYPKSKFNEDLNTLNITNYVELKGTYQDRTESEVLASNQVNINLNDFVFTYTGELYGIKKSNAYDSHYYQFLLDPNFNYHDPNTRYGFITNDFRWSISSTCVYTGTPLTVHLGDDLLYITDKDSNYRKLEENEYYYYVIGLPSIKNLNNINIPYDKYTINLYVRYQDETNYVFYEKLTSESTAFYFSQEDKVVSFYYEFLDFSESIVTSLTVKTTLRPTENIAQNGTVYNFDYLNVYFKDVNGNLILQNEPADSSYANFITKEEILNFDQDTYNHNMQRSCAKKDYSYYEGVRITNYFDIHKSMTSFVQDKNNMEFTGTTTISMGLNANTDNDDLPQTDVLNYIKKTYFTYTNNLSGAISSFEGYDLLPEGMDLTSSTEEILSNLYVSSGISSSVEENNFWHRIFNKEGTKLFSSKEEVSEYFRNHTTIEIIENWKNTNRTMLKWTVDLTDQPLYFIVLYPPSIYIKYNHSVSYDNYLEFGGVWKNSFYANGYFEEGGKITLGSGLSSIYRAEDIYDFNFNNDFAETFIAYDYERTITSVVSSHQNIVTYVQTDKNNFTTDNADSSFGANYSYKLRVQAGAANVTNLRIHSNIEMAEKGKERWQGEFIGIDTSYAEKQGYIIKPYYSENPNAGNLYIDGEINPEWKEFIPTKEKIIANGLRIKFSDNCSSDYSDSLCIYYYKDGKLYKSKNYERSELTGKTIDVPGTDVYFYWKTNSYNNSYYGFSIDSITPKTIITGLGEECESLPEFTPIEINGDNYPESPHNPYENNSNILWHYTCNDRLILQEESHGTDTSKVKSIAFDYFDTDGNPAVLKANNMSYVIIKMKAPVTEETSYARMNCWSQWNAIDEFDRPVYDITGINSNIVRVALPSTILNTELHTISLKFIKEINGTDAEFENMKLDKADTQTFMIRLTSLTANDDGSYNQVTALLKSNQELIISQVPAGTYLLEELGDNYFDFVEFTENNGEDIVIEGVTFERTNQGYIITVSEDLTEAIEFNIKVTNEIEDERFYEDKDNKENLFLKNKIEENS